MRTMYACMRARVRVFSARSVFVCVYVCVCFFRAIFLRLLVFYLWRLHRHTRYLPAARAPLCLREKCCILGT